MIKKMFFLILFMITAINAVNPLVPKKSWLQEIKEWWNSFITHDENKSPVKNIILDYAHSRDTIIKEFNLFLPDMNLEDFIKERQEKKQYLYNCLYSNYTFGKQIPYKQTIEKFSAIQIELFKNICKNYRINSSYINIVIDYDLSEDTPIKIVVKRDTYPMILLNKNVDWEKCSPEVFVKILNQQLSYLVEGYAFDDQTMHVLIDKATNNIKNPLSIRDQTAKPNFFSKNHEILRKNEDKLERWHNKINQAMSKGLLLALKKIIKKYENLKNETRRKIREAHENI